MQKLLNNSRLIIFFLSSIIELWKKVFAVIDLKSFYATVECIKRGLDPFKAPLVVCDEFRGPGSIIMSVTPYLKTLGCKNVMRRFDLPPNINYIYARPNMEAYVLKSTEFNALLLDYFADEDIHPYSIDETFIHLTPYLSLYKLSPYDLMLKDYGRGQISTWSYFSFRDWPKYVHGQMCT